MKAVRALAALTLLWASVLPAPARAAAPVVELSLSAAGGMERVDGEGLATLVPRLGIRAGALQLDLAPPLRMVVFSEAGEFGLRDRDWDARSEWLRPLERLSLRTADGSAGVFVSGNAGLTLGRGAVVDGYRPALLPDAFRAGLHAHGRLGPLGAELFTHDVLAWEVLAMRLAVTPFGGEAPPETGLGSLTLAFDVAADRNAPLAQPSAATGRSSAPLAIGAAELRMGVLRDARLALGVWMAGGASSHDQQFGLGAEAGAVLGWLDAARRRRLLEVSLAPVWASGAWLPGRMDAAYEFERDRLGGQLDAVDAAGGLGFGLRARVRAEPLPGLVLRGQARTLPWAPGALDLDAYAASVRVQNAFAALPGEGLDAELGWMRRPGGIHLMAGSASWAFWPQLRAGVRIERALHGANRRTWDLGLWVSVGLSGL